LGVISYALGLVGRAWYVFIDHPYQEHIYSDMNGYLESAKRLVLFPVGQQNISDTVYPPGTAYLFGYLMKFGVTGFKLSLVQLVMSAALPVLLFLIAYELTRSRVVSHFALIVSSLYVPLAYYSGFFLSENPFQFFLFFAFYLLVRSEFSVGKLRPSGFALLSGLIFAAAASLKSIGLVVGVIFLILTVVRVSKFELRRACLILASFSVGILIIILPLSQRCTRLSDGQRCLIANDFSRNYLLGHLSEVGLVTWRDPARGFTHYFGNPTYLTRGQSKNYQFDFGVYENAKNIKLANEYIGSDPMLAVRVGLRNVWDLFFHGIPWPAPPEKWRTLFLVTNLFYCLILLIPSLLVFWTLRRQVSVFGIEAQLLSPLVLLSFAVFITAPEVRYRYPLDGFTILLAGVFWNQQRPRLIALWLKISR
jgi:hypothetical protein